jgi:hypothetical protein
MALQVYAAASPLDNDGRYDVGMIHTVMGDYESALAQADSLDALAPGHLLATLIRYAVAEARGDADAVRSAYQAFLASYATETDAERIEYHAHQRTIEAFYQRAQQATGVVPG